MKGRICIVHIQFWPLNPPCITLCVVSEVGRWVVMYVTFMCKLTTCGEVNMVTDSQYLDCSSFAMVSEGQPYMYMYVCTGYQSMYLR